MIRISKFGIRHSAAFGIRHLAFVIRHSSFGIRHSAFVIRHSSFGIRRSVIRHSAFGILAFGILHFGIRHLTFPFIRHLPHCFHPGPRTTRPGFLPVCSPSRNTGTPLTRTCLIPVAYWCGFSNVA
jgi:hypothetical protein